MVFLPLLTIAQKLKKPDTIYYFVDILHTPVADRMINIEHSHDYAWYTIKCPCLKYGNMPLFRSNVTNQTYIDKKMFKSIKFTYLDQLIKYVKDHDSADFNDRHAIFFIMLSDKKYIQQQCFLNQLKNQLSIRK